MTNRSFVIRTATKKRTALTSRGNENGALIELSSMLPIGHQLSSVDEISVLRFTTAYVKMKMFLQEASIFSDKNLYKAYSSVGGDSRSLFVKNPAVPNGENRKALQTTSSDIFDLSTMFNKAMDGFLIVVAPDLTVLYVTENVTRFIGLTQTEVVGHSLLDLMHGDDQNSVEMNLMYDPAVKIDASQRQWRQLYVRFRTSFHIPGSSVLKLNGHKIMQISGFIKCTNISASNSQEHPKSLGLIALCCLMESMSIENLAIERSSFTSTTTLDLKFTTVESRVTALIGYKPEDLIGMSVFAFVHPHDFNASKRHMVKYKQTVHNQGMCMSHIYRLLTMAAHWVQFQVGFVMCCVPGTNTPSHFKVTCKILSSVHKLDNNTQFDPKWFHPKRNMQTHYTHTEPQWSHMKKRMECCCTTLCHGMNGGFMCSTHCHQERYSFDQSHAVESHMCLACYNGSNYPNNPHFECTCVNCVHRLRSTSRSFGDCCYKNQRSCKSRVEDINISTDGTDYERQLNIVVSSPVWGLDRNLVGNLLGSFIRKRPREYMDSSVSLQDCMSATIIKKYKDRFLSYIDARAIVTRLEIEEVIPDTVSHKIQQSAPSVANEILFLHLRSHSSLETLHKLCDVMIGMSGYPKMNELGRLMKDDLTTVTASIQ